MSTSATTADATAICHFIITATPDVPPALEMPPASNPILLRRGPETVWFGSTAAREVTTPGSPASYLPDGGPRKQRRLAPPRLVRSTQPKRCSPGGSVSIRSRRPRPRPMNADAINSGINRRGPATVATPAAKRLALTIGRPGKLKIQIKLNPVEALVANLPTRPFGRIANNHVDMADRISTTRTKRVLTTMAGPCAAEARAIGTYRSAATVSTAAAAPASTLGTVR